MKIIKRYQNRKLYDTNNHHYITIKELRTLIENKEPLVVIDNSSGANITNRAIVEAYCDYLRDNQNNQNVISNIMKELQSTNS